MAAFIWGLSHYTAHLLSVVVFSFILFSSSGQLCYVFLCYLFTEWGSMNMMRSSSGTNKNPPRLRHESTKTSGSGGGGSNSWMSEASMESMFKELFAGNATYNGLFDEHGILDPDSKKVRIHTKPILFISIFFSSVNSSNRLTLQVLDMKHGE